MNNTITILGYEFRSGTFYSADQGKEIQYNNVVFHISSSSKSNVIGKSVDFLKVKREKVTEFLSQELNETVLNKEFEPVYDIDYTSNSIKLVGLKPVSVLVYKKND